MTNGLPDPEKVTLRLLFDHMPLKGWIMLCGLIATSFSFGVFASSLADKANKQSPAIIKWEGPAREAGWRPSTECPTEPLVLSITSPGDGTKIRWSGSSKPPQVIVKTSRPLATYESLALIYNQGEKENYIVRYPSYDFSNKQQTPMVISPDSLDLPKQSCDWHATEMGSSV